MGTFESAKVGFALALLGVVFTVHPIVMPYLDVPLLVFGIAAPLRLFYLTFVGSLVVSVYLYGLDLLSERPKNPIRTAGNVFYAFAVVIPLITAVLAVASPVIAWLGAHLDLGAAFASTVSGLISAVVGAYAQRRVSLPRISGRVSDRPYAASCNCISYAAGLR